MLCSVPCWRISLPIMFNVFLLFSYEIFLIPSSISVASFAPYIGDLSIALIVLLFVMLYFSCISLFSLNGVHCNPYWTCACIAPTIRFLLMSGVIPLPLNMNGTSCWFVLSALYSWFSICAPWVRSCSIVFPKYLYFSVLMIWLPWYVSVPL